MKKFVIAAALCAAAILHPAFAQDTAPASTATVAPAPASTTMPAPAATTMPAPESTVAPPAAPAAATTKAVPKLVFSWDCGECEHNDKVIPLIEASYAEAALKRGFVVSETETADVAIVDIRQRPPGVRVMFGIMAGKDRLGLRIRHNGYEFAVSDSSANAISGLNSLSKTVGQRALLRLTMSPPESAKMKQ